MVDILPRQEQRQMFIDVNGIRMHYELYGEGSPLLWLHGFMGAGGDWRYIFEAPPPGYRLIAPELRGHGASTIPTNGYTHRACAEDVLALLQHLNVETINAIGLSGGGIVLLHMAARVPSRIARMVTVSAPPRFPDQARHIQRNFSWAMLSDVEQRLMRERHQREGQIDWLLAQARAFVDSYDDVDFTSERLSAIAAETLIVFGDRDPLYPLESALELRRAIPRSYLWVVPNGGHAPVFGSHARLFAAMSKSFIDGSLQTS